MKITKLLSLDSKPAPALLARAKKITLTAAERLNLPFEFHVDNEKLENALGDVRPLEVDDVLVDENGCFYQVKAGIDQILKVSGDLEMMQEAVYAFSARGIRIAQTDDGFAVLANPQFKSMLESVGLKCEIVDAPFEPIPLPRRHHGGGCCCGGPGHGEGHGHGECGCGGLGHGVGHGHGECGCGHKH